MSNTCHKNLSFELIIFEYLNNLSYKSHSLLPTIVQSSNEWTDIRCSSLSRKNCLISRKYECNVSFYTFFFQPFNCFHPFWNHWDFNNDILTILLKPMRFFYHFLKFGTNNLKTHRSI